MGLFNRVVAALLWLTLLGILAVFAVLPFETIRQAQVGLEWTAATLSAWQEANTTNFLIAQAAFGVVVVLLFGALFWLELWAGRRRGVRIRTVDGGSAELDTTSISRRLEWRLDQLAEVIRVVPLVKSRGGSVDLTLEIEAAPDVDIPMKTDEVVDVTRDIIEQDMGLKLGKLEVHMRCAPFAPDWAP
ncbi:MAG: hypothetical protein KJZ93_21090 [Caldilineaceae bacterium]|nr:hypothetical protein [Caldilineaceae bacterium]